MSSDGNGQFYEMGKNYKTVDAINYKFALSNDQVKSLSEITGVKKITTGDVAVPNYRHLLMRLGAESVTRINAGVIKKVDLEEGVKFDENLRTYSPMKFSNTALAAWFEPDASGVNDSKEQFKIAISNDKIVAAVAKRSRYGPGDIIFKPMEVVPDIPHKVRFTKDTMYYVPLAHAIQQYAVGDVLIMQGWHNMDIGEYFGGELTIEETDFVDKYGRKCLSHAIVGESTAKIHPKWEVKTGYVHEVTLPIIDHEEIQPFDEAQVPGGLDVYYYCEPLLNNLGRIRTFSCKKISKEEYEKSKVRSSGSTLDELMIKSSAKLAAAKASAREERVKKLEAMSEGLITDEDEVEDVIFTGKPKKRQPLNAAQMAARVDVDYKDPKVTASRANSIVLTEYADIEINEKSDLVDEIMRLVCENLHRRKTIRNKLTEAVLQEWEAYTTPSSNPAQGLFTAIRGQFFGAIRSASNGVVNAGTSVKGYAGKKVKASKKSAAAGQIIGTIMPLIAVLMVGVAMFAFMAIVSLFMFRMYRSTVRAAGWTAAIMTAFSGLSKLGDSPDEGFFAAVKEHGSNIGILTGAALGSAVKKAGF